jgi:ATP-dependent DNA helicase RecQ
MLKEADIVRETRGTHFSLLRRDEPGASLEQLARQYEERGEADRTRLERMIQYAQSALCRWKILLEYFGEKMDWERCGNCDTCLHPVEASVQPPRASFERPRPRPTVVPADAPSPTRGQVVRLPDFGEGEVLDLHGDKILVAFPNGDQKLFKKDFAQ